MKGWKVLSPNRRSCRAYNWGASKWPVDYPVGKEVFPRVEGTKLFFFKNKKDAEKFAYNWDIIVPCIAKGATKVQWVGLRFTRLMEFWENRSKAQNKRTAPSGTWFAESITYLEEIITCLN